MVSIHSSEKGNSGLLFKGYITECKINSRESSGIVYVELTSTSMELDKKYENESYQKKGESYKKIIETVASKSKGINSYCSGDLKKEKLEKPIIQYKETNWEFIKRIASRFRLPVIADVTTDKPTFTIGYNQQSSAEEKDFIKARTTEFIRMGEYCIRR